jgi:glucosamine kinase
LLFLPFLNTFLHQTMTNNKFVLGIDGGGTKTSAELCDHRGDVLATAVAGPTNFQIIGLDRTSKTLLNLILAACRRARLPVERLAATVIGLTGAGRTSDQRVVIRALRALAREKRISLRNVSIESDAIIGLEGAFSGKAGVVVIVGTGSIVFAKDKRGRIIRAGGWGRILGDEGSGYAIGREAFGAVARFLDGETARTILPQRIARRFNLRTQEEIIRAIYREGFDLSAAAPVVIEAATKKDPVAMAILRQAADELSATVRRVILRMKSGDRKENFIPLAFVGGLGKEKNVYLRLLRGRIARKFPEIVFRSPDWPPVHGASLMALAKIGIK